MSRRYIYNVINGGLVINEKIAGRAVKEEV